MILLSCFVLMIKKVTAHQQKVRFWPTLYMYVVSVFPISAAFSASLALHRTTPVYPVCNILNFFVFLYSYTVAFFQWWFDLFFVFISVLLSSIIFKLLDESRPCNNNHIARGTEDGTRSHEAHDIAPCRAGDISARLISIDVSRRVECKTRSRTGVSAFCDCHCQ